MKKWFGGILTMLFVGMVNVVSAADNGGCWAGSCCEQEDGAYLQVEALLWKACRSGMDYALEASGIETISTGTAKPLAIAGSIKDGRMHAMTFDWNFGFRAALGYRLDCDHWDVKAEYTRFHSDAIGSLTDVNGVNTPLSSANDPDFSHTRYHPLIGRGFNADFEIASGFDGTALGRFEKASAKLELGYDVIDVVLGHSYCPCPSFELHPYGGFRGLFLKQDITVDYMNGDYAATGHRVLWSSDYNAFGLHGGTDWYYHVCGDFSFYGDFGFSVVVGEPDGHQKQTSHFDDNPAWDTPPVDNEVEIFESDHCLVSCGCDAAVGIMWERCCGDTVVALTLGYELHKWNNVPEQRRFFDSLAYGIASDTRTATLGFHGALFRGRVDF